VASISEGWSDDGPPEEPLATRLAAPVVVLAAAALAVALGLALAFVAGPLAHVLGYLFASVLAFTLVAIYRRGALERVFDEGVAPSRSHSMAAVAILAAGFVVAALQAWLIARHYA
jgi:hypothetical protein